MKKVKEFTLRKSKNCSGYLFDSSGKKCCITGAFFHAAGAPMTKLQGVATNKDITSELQNLYSKELEKSDTSMEAIVDEAMGVNDSQYWKRCNWQRRMKRFREIFGRIGVKIRFRD